MAKKGGFVDAVKDRSKPYQRCGVAKVLNVIEDRALRSEVDAALDMADLPSTAIAAELTARGFPISDQAVGRHRRRICSCFKQ